MAGPVVTAALIASALVLTLLAPRLLARWLAPRTDPLRGLLLWQAVAVSGVLCALLAAPVAALTLGRDHPLLLGMALLLSAVMLARVLWSGHRVGTDLRRLRAEHRAMVDLLGERLEGVEEGVAHDPVTVLAHPSPTAYCLPGGGDRIVLSQATIDRLGPEELRAVLAHEQAHLDHRHDLLLELFTVLHEAVPAPVRAPAALREVHLLAELLADHRAAARASAPSLARALVAMVEGSDAGAGRPGHAGAPRDARAPAGAGPDRPEARLQPALSAAGAQVGTRLTLLAQPPAPRRLRTTLAGGALAVTALPVVLLLTLVWA